MGGAEPFQALERMRLERRFGDGPALARAQALALREAERETDRETYQAMEALVHNLNTMHSRAGAQVPFSSLNYGTDTSPEGRSVVKNLLLDQGKEAAHVHHDKGKDHGDRLGHYREEAVLHDHHSKVAKDELGHEYTGSRGDLKRGKHGDEHHPNLPKDAIKLFGSLLI